jgi:transposase
MLIPLGSVKIFLSTQVTDMRKSIDGLCLVVQEVLVQNPGDGALFVFCNRGRDKMKLLHYDGTGFCLFYKRLDRGRFQLPKQETPVGLSWPELHDLLQGVPIAPRAALKPTKPASYTVYG